MTILVTGGAGFIGANFVIDWLAQGGEPVINFDKLTYAGNLENLASLKGNNAHVFVQGDIGDTEKVAQVLTQRRPRAVLNFAAESHVDRSIHSPEDFIQTNIVGTYRLLEASRAYVAGMSAAEKTAFRFLHVSTDEVYGSLGFEAPAFTEEHVYQPNSPYSASKAAAIRNCESLRVELRSAGVAVVTICPGYIRTPMTAVNKFKMPFLIDVDQAVIRFARAIERKTSFTVIPWSMGIAARLLRIAPNWLYDRVFQRMPRKPR